MQLKPLVSQSPVIVYIDIKSPYAYLAVEPTRELERELGIEFDWRPFVLDIPSYLGSAELDDSGSVAAHDRSAEQWAGVKYAYYDCRRYAGLSNITIRGTVKIWDTDLISTAMLWAKKHSFRALQEFIDLVYQPFWKRELDIDDSKVIEALLDAAGTDGSNFLAWAESEGFALNRKLQDDAFRQGIYGVPTYVVDDQLYFGRENLPRVGWLLSDRTAPAPDKAYTLPAQSIIPKIKPVTISIGIEQSLDCLIAIPALKELLDAHGLSANWVRIQASKPNSLPAVADQSRGAKHSHYRLANQKANLARYAPPILDTQELSDAIEQTLIEHRISLVNEGALDVVNPALPGVVIKIDENIFIGRQHLPYIRALLG